MEPTDLRLTIRTAFAKALPALGETGSLDLEIGVFNYAIRESARLGVARSWESAKFHRIYATKAKFVLANVLRSPHRVNLICPHDFVFANVHDLEQPRWRDIKLDQETKFASAYEDAEVAMTSAFTCGKCKGNKCSYYLLQCRSGDEGMSTFVKCISCGNRWRMS